MTSAGDQHLADLQAWATEIAQISPIERRPTLLAWARSQSLSGYLFAEEPLSDIASEAIKILSDELNSDSPGNAWARTPYRAGRKAILDALRIDPREPTAFYATFPFRLLRVNDRPFIGAAIHPPSPIDPSPYTELDISDVILWNPRSGEMRGLGDPRLSIVGPDKVKDRLTVYADGFAFFRAWAEARAEIGQRHVAARAGNWAHPGSDPADGAIPGALVIGDLAKAPIPLDVAVLEAGPGIDPKDLTRAIYRRAALPRVQARKAA